MKKATLLLLVVFYTLTGKAQNVYPEKFTGCNTDQFALESDSITGKIDMKYFIKTILSGVDEHNREKLSGILSLQIIIDSDGRSCLMSIENKTNVSSEELNLKETIDNSLIWQKPRQKVSPMIMLKFNPTSVQYKRIGMNANKGMHLIEEDEILIH